MNDQTQDAPNTAADTIQTVASLAGAATGQIWVGPALAALRSLWPEVSKLFTPGTSEVAQRNVKAAEAVVNAVITATGASNAQAAVEKVQADPAVAMTARTMAVDMMGQFGLIEVGGGIEAARKANVDSSTPPFWKTGAAYVTAMVIPLVYYVVFEVVRQGSPFGADIRAAVVTAVVTGALGSVMGFWLGTSFKNSTIQSPK